MAPASSWMAGARSSPHRRSEQNVSRTGSDSSPLSVAVCRKGPLAIASRAARLSPRADAQRVRLLSAPVLLRVGRGRVRRERRHGGRVAEAREDKGPCREPAGSGGVRAGKNPREIGHLVERSVEAAGRDRSRRGHWHGRHTGRLQTRRAAHRRRGTGSLAGRPRRSTSRAEIGVRRAIRSTRFCRSPTISSLATSRSSVTP